MKTFAALLVAALSTVALMLAPPAQAAATIPTHTGLQPVGRHGCSVYLTAMAQHYSPKRRAYVASPGQYVQLQVWRKGAWHYRAAVLVHTTNNAAWADQTLIIRSCARHKYRAVTPPAWYTATTYRLGSHSAAKRG